VPGWSAFSRSAARLLLSIVMANTVNGTIQATTLTMEIWSQTWPTASSPTGTIVPQVVAVEFSGDTSWCCSSLPTVDQIQPVLQRMATVSSRAVTSSRALLMLCVDGATGVRARSSVAAAPDRVHTCVRSPRSAVGKSAPLLRIRPSPSAAMCRTATLLRTALASGAGGWMMCGERGGRHARLPAGAARQPVTTMSSPTRRTEAQTPRATRPT
jgi:hypothetical protein